MSWIAVAVGGALGSLARYGISQVMHSGAVPTRWPLATLTVNLAGCFLAGLITGLLASERIPAPFSSREFLLAGLLGGFTTFSAFAVETLMLARGGSSGPAAVNVLVQVAGGLAAVWAGYYLGAQDA